MCILRSARLVKAWNVKNIPPLLAAEHGTSAEQLINSRSGRIHLFPAAPEDASVAFRDMQARGGFEVSAERIKGVVTYVRIASRRDVTCRMMNPWPRTPVLVREQRSNVRVEHGVDTANGECIVFEAEKDRAYLIGPDGT